MKLFFNIILVLIVFKISAQSDSLLKNFDDSRNHKTHQAMIVLTSWAGGNIGASVAGFVLTNSYEEKQFYIMNGAWGAINMCFALPGLVSKPKPTGTWYDVQKHQTNVEKLFLANAALDLAYIMRGTYYLEKAKSEVDPLLEKRDRGFGNAIVIQGAGLFIFDLAMTFVHNRHRKKQLDPIFKNTSLNFSGNTVGLIYRIN